ncbi:MAG TPA: DUF6011 domain-containing protein [Blastocatellia bacterium]|nr:DUF6011 domain-containing protein [Blastocatellia bacterium]
MSKFTAQCRRCRRALTDPESQRRGLGPECASAREHLVAWARTLKEVALPTYEDSLRRTARHAHLRWLETGDERHLAVRDSFLERLAARLRRRDVMKEVA